MQVPGRPRVCTCVWRAGGGCWGQCRGRGRRRAADCGTDGPGPRPDDPRPARRPQQANAPPRRRLRPVRPVSQLRQRPHSTWWPALGRTAAPWRRDRSRTPRMRLAPLSSLRARRAAARPSGLRGINRGRRLGARNPRPTGTKLPRCGRHSACCCSWPTPWTRSQ